MTAHNWKSKLKAIGLAITGLAFGSGRPAHADTYTYDQYGRLTQVVYTTGGTVTYTYDAAGNRTQVHLH